jgi:CRP-like cAMP-binding protein
MAGAAKDKCSLSADELALLFPFIPGEERITFCSYFEYRQIPAETDLIVQGETGDFMGFLVSGKLAVKKETSFAGKYILLAILEQGAMFGEISMVENNKRTANVISMEECRLLILSRAMADRLMAEKPTLAILFLKQVVLVVGRRLQKIGDRLASLL